jgi:hypothetical protein
MNWLEELAKTDADRIAEENSELQSTIDSLPLVETLAMADDFGILSVSPNMDSMKEKISMAEKVGSELAREHGDQLEKAALLPLIGTGLKAIAGGLASGAVKGAVSGGVKNVTDVAHGAAGGFKYAHNRIAITYRDDKRTSVQKKKDDDDDLNRMMSALKMHKEKVALSLPGLGGAGTLGQKIVGGLVRHPQYALPAVGAVGGALMAPRDPQTGQKHYLKGALLGAGLGVGANVTGVANKARHAILNPSNPLLGEGVANYARQATKATGPAANRALAGAVKDTVPAASTQLAKQRVPSGATMGPVSGTPKLEPSMMSPIEGGPSAGANTMYRGGPMANPSAKSNPAPLAAPKANPVAAPAPSADPYASFRQGGANHLVPGVSSRNANGVIKSAPGRRAVDTQFGELMKQHNPKGYEAQLDKARQAQAAKAQIGMDNTAPQAPIAKNKVSPIQAGEAAMGPAGLGNQSPYALQEARQQAAGGNIPGVGQGRVAEGFTPPPKAPGAKTMVMPPDWSPLSKAAAIFGANLGAVDHPAIPYNQRKKEYTSYVKTKSNERPTGYLKGSLGGGLIGAGLGAGAGALSGLAHGRGVKGLAGVGAAAGGIGGLLSGLAMAKHDKNNIRRAQSALKSKNIDSSLSGEITRRQNAKDWNETFDRRDTHIRHRELVDAIRNR